MKNKISCVKNGNNYTITHISIVKRGNRGRIFFTTYHLNEYGSWWANDDLWVAKNYKTLLEFAEQDNIDFC